MDFIFCHNMQLVDKGYTFNYTIKIKNSTHTENNI